MKQLLNISQARSCTEQQMVKMSEQIFGMGLAECLNTELEPKDTSMFLAYRLFAYILAHFYGHERS